MAEKCCGLLRTSISDFIRAAQLYSGRAAGRARPQPGGPVACRRSAAGEPGGQAPGRPREERHPDHPARRTGAPGIVGSQARSAHRIPRAAGRGEDQNPGRGVQREPVAHGADRRQDHRGALDHRAAFRITRRPPTRCSPATCRRRRFSIPRWARWSRTSSDRRTICRRRSGCRTFRSGAGTGYLSSKYGAFELGADPGAEELSGARHLAAQGDDGGALRAPAQRARGAGRSLPAGGIESRRNSTRWAISTSRRTS